jgi:hypothetical protein
LASVDRNEFTVIAVKGHLRSEPVMSVIGIYQQLTQRDDLETARQNRGEPPSVTFNEHRSGPCISINDKKRRSNE